MLSADDKLLVADALSGDIITRLSGHDDGVFAIAVASDGRWLASASGDQTIKVWEVSTGREVRTFRTSDEVRALALSWDLRVVSAGSDGSVWVWDVAGDERGHPLGGHGERIVDVILSPDGQFAAGASSRALVLWDLSTGREVRRYASADTGPAVVAFTPDGRSLVSGNWDGTLTVFEVSTGRPGRTITEGISRISAMAFSPTGARLVVGRDDGGLQLWRLADPRPAAMLRGHRERIVSVVFSPDGAWVVTGSHDGTVHLWDGSTGQEVRTFRAGAAVTATALTHDGRRVMAGSRHGAIRVWDRESGLEMQSLSAPQVDITGLAASADGQRLLSWGGNWWDRNGTRVYEGSTLMVWDLATGRLVDERFLEGALHAAISPDGRLAITDTGAGSLWMLETEGLRVKRVLSGHRHWVLGMALSRDGRILLSGGQDHTLRSWDLARPEGSCLLADDEPRPWVLAATPDGRFGASAGDGGTVRVWNLMTGQEVARLVSYVDGAWAAWTVDGHYQGSPGIESRLHLRVDDETRDLPAYRSLLNRPDRVQAHLARILADAALGDGLRCGVHGPGKP